jgi:hypothetical protein
MKQFIVYCGWAVVGLLPFASLGKQMAGGCVLEILDGVVHINNTSWHESVMKCAWGP